MVLLLYEPPAAYSRSPRDVNGRKQELELHTQKVHYMFLNEYIMYTHTQTKMLTSFAELLGSLRIR